MAKKDDANAIARAISKMKPSELKAALAKRLPSVWACVNRTIDGFPWKFRGREYLIDIHDCDARKMVLLGGAGWGKTQTIINRLLKRVKEDGWSGLVIYPTADEVADFSQGDFQEAYETSPTLGGFFDINNVHFKRAGARRIYFRGSQKMSKMKGLHVNFFWVDEKDHCVQDNIIAAKERLSGKDAEIREMLESSNPTIPDYGIEADYGRSDQRMYYVRCGACKKSQIIEFPDNYRWREGSPSTAKMVCRHCKKAWATVTFRKMVREARTNGLGWVASYPGRDVAGFRLSQLYCPTVSAQDIVSAWEEAQGDSSKLSTFYRLKLGVGYSCEGAQLTPDIIEEAVAEWSAAGTSRYSFAGVDVGARIHMEIAEFPEGPSGMKRVIWAGSFRDFKDVAQKIRQYNVATCVIDAAPELREVDRLRKQFPQVYAAYYPSINETHQWFPMKGRVNLNRTFWIDQAIARFRNRNVVLPNNIPKEYKNHFCNIVRVEDVDSRGNPVARWVNTGQDHFVHASVYCEAAASRAGRPFEWDLEPDLSFHETGYSGRLGETCDWSEGYMN